MVTSGPPSGQGCPGRATPCGWRPSRSIDAEPSEEAGELAREYRAVLENILLSRGAGRIANQLRDITDPGRLADVAGYSPDLSLSQKVEVLETLDVEDRLRKVLGWARDTLADLTLRERIKTDVEEGMEKTQREFLLRRQLEAIRKELGPAGRRRQRRARRLPAEVGRARAARARARRRPARGRQARADQRAEPRDGVDPHVARHRLRASLGRRVRGPARSGRSGSHSWTRTTTGWST